ncbi:hypothetical protein ABVK25_000268 [Lepraria finkii]|uniref:Uncharacterized protein n=1 Tax=Lepraria finkii TaxID=1340010 RepID=A0ABR4BME7_9LECA
MNNWLRRRGLPPAALLQDFLNTLTVWEIEELDAVRSHIRAEVNAVQRNRIAGASSDDLTDQPLLLQKKIRDLDYWRSEPHLPTDHLLVVDLHHPHAIPHSAGLHILDRYPLLRKRPQYHRQLAIHAIKKSPER